MTRDISLLVPEDVHAAEVASAAVRAAGRLLEAVDLLDEYRGSGLPAGRRALAFRLRYRAPDRTLRDQEVDASVAKVLAAVREQHGVELRTT